MTDPIAELEMLNAELARLERERTVIRRTIPAGAARAKAVARIATAMNRVRVQRLTLLSELPDVRERKPN